MNGFDVWQSSHRALSMLDLRFREMAKDSPMFLDRKQFKILDEANLDFRLQSWPTFIGPEKLEEFKRVSVGISRLLRSVPERIFNSDPVKISNFFSLGSPSVAEILFTQPTGAETMISRGDLIETASGYKCIEFNFTPSLGGLDTSVVTGLQLAAPPTAGFLASEGIRFSYTDTILEMLRHIIEDVQTKGILRADEISIALVTEPHDVPFLASTVTYLNREIRRTLEFLGMSLNGRFTACSHDRLVVKGNSLFLDHRRIDAVVELTRSSTPPPIYRLLKGDFIGLYNGPIGIILSNKRNMALLSQYAASGIYSPEERAFIEETVPWTRLVAQGPVEFGGKTQPLVELLKAHQELFVLKDSDACGGKGVLLGRFSSREEWLQMLDRALLEGDWVVQAVVQSLPYLYQNGDFGCSIHDMIWGPFVFGNRYGGVVLRMQPKAVGGAVNLSLSATEGIVLEV